MSVLEQEGERSTTSPLLEKDLDLFKASCRSSEVIHSTFLFISLLISSLSLPKIKTFLIDSMELGLILEKSCPLASPPQINKVLFLPYNFPKNYGVGGPPPPNCSSFVPSPPPQLEGFPPPPYV